MASRRRCRRSPARARRSPPLPLPPQAARLTLVQILINAKGLAMNPLQSLYYVSPACLLCLAVPFGACCGASHSLRCRPRVQDSSSAR